MNTNFSSLASAAGVTAAALTLMLTAPGAVEGQEGFELEVRGGIPMSSGDHAVIYDPGYSGGLALNWWLRDRWGVRLDADVLRYKADEDQETTGFPGDFPDSHLGNGHVAVATRLLRPDDAGVLLQLNGGAGMTMFDSGDIGDPDVNDTFLSLSGGAQLGFGVGPALLGVDARIYYVFGDANSMCPLTQWVDALDVDPTTCAATGPSSVEAMETIVAYPISVFLRFGF